MADESPLDRFKSVLTGASRAIAHDSEVEVNWTADAPSASAAESGTSSALAAREIGSDAMRTVIAASRFSRIPA